jgi:Pregnancy-associated plasma protein-A
MRKFKLLVIILLFAGCTKTNSDKQVTVPEQSISTSLQKRCASYEVLQEQLKADPTLQQRMNEIEAFTSRYIQNPSVFRLLADGSLEVPVVVNILYNKPSENISDKQVASQIEILNKDFSGTNKDVNSTDTYNEVKAGDIKIKFVLKQTIRQFTDVTSFSTNNAMKHSNRGGIDATDPATTLNMWVCTMSGGILGYAQFPGGNKATDGVVILNTAFGEKGTTEAPYNLGRTATHEIGHYFNLRHIWGDRQCGNDYIDDTPLHDTYNFGCPPAGHRSLCAGTPVEMTMNYMDYTDDPCMYMFTKGQALRMQATYAAGGPRESLAQ